METFLTDFIGYALTKVLWDYSCCLWLWSVTIVLETFFFCKKLFLGFVLLVIWRVMKSNKWNFFFPPKKGKNSHHTWAHDNLWVSAALLTQMLGRDSGTVWNLILHARQSMKLSVEYFVTVSLFSLSRLWQWGNFDLRGNVPVPSASQQEASHRADGAAELRAEWAAAAADEHRGRSLCHRRAPWVQAQQGGTSVVSAGNSHWELGGLGRIACALGKWEVNANQCYKHSVPEVL